MKKWMMAMMVLALAVSASAAGGGGGYAPRTSCRLAARSAQLKGFGMKARLLSRMPLRAMTSAG